MTYEDAWVNKGVVLGQLQKYEEAIDCFDNALKLNPHSEEAIRGRDLCMNLLSQNK